MEAFYGYRLPGNGTETIAFRSCSIADGIRNGFAVAPFRQDRHRTLSFTGGEKADISGLDSFARRINITAPFSGSTTREQHRMEVERIVTEVQSGNLIKAVAARQLVMESEFSLSNTFLRLCLEYPEAFIFCFGSEATGIWLGASPETLVAGQRGLLTSMALAGTRSAEASGDWDDKNLKEHNVVRDFIRDAFESAGLDAETGPTHTAQAGPVEHLRTYHRQDSGGRRPVRHGGSRRTRSSAIPYSGSLRFPGGVCDADYQRMRELRPKLLRRLLRAISE